MGHEGSFLLFSLCLFVAPSEKGLRVLKPRPRKASVGELGRGHSGLR